MKRTILLGVTGGIAAIKIPDLIGKLTPHYNIEVIQTQSAEHILSANQIEKLTGNRVYTTLFDKTFDANQILKKRQVEHISLSDRADLFVIVPATANVIAKLAAGFADDYLTTTALAVTCPILVCPSMNVHMWRHPATQKNMNTLRTFGYHVSGPDAGMLACGYEGEGRLIDIDTLASSIAAFMSLTKPLSGKKVLVTAGGTIEPIDDIRYISNKSSGKMGIALAEAATMAGAEVLLLRSITSVLPRLAINEEVFDTADSLEMLMKKYCPKTDICIHTAAVSDFAIKNYHQGKTSSTKPLALELEPRKKILESIKKMNPKIFLVAFKAEYNVSDKKLVELATLRLTRAHADMIVANDVGRKNQGFQSNENEVILIDANAQITYLPKAAKSVIAEKIIQILIKKILT